MSVPNLEVSQAAIPLVRDAYLDGDKYASYLEYRGVPEEAIDQLQMVVEPMNRFARSSFRIDKETSLPTIGFSAINFPTEDSRQGNQLRHQTEHFIERRNKPNFSRNHRILIGASAAAGALVGLKAGFNVVPQFDLRSLGGLPGLETEWKDGLLALSGLAGALVGELSVTELSPGELRANKAEDAQRTNLPDGILNIELNRRPRRLR